MLDRRRFLAASGLAVARLLVPWPLRAVAAAGAPATAPSRDPAPDSAAAGKAPTGCAAGLEVARQHILRYCATLAFPNGAIHAVRALGRSCPLGPGDPYRLLLESFVVERPIRDKLFLEVPVENEGHRNAMLKTLLEKGCEMELSFSLHGRPCLFRELVESARLLTSYPGSLAIDEHSWTIIALSRVVPRAQARWTNAFGDKVDLERMIDDTSDALERDTALIRQVDLSGADPPRDCPVLARACGGLHMLYAYAAAMASGYSTPARMRALARHVRTTLRRLVYDMKVTDAVERQNVLLAGTDAAGAVAFDARVKFLGHLMEIVGVIDRAKLYNFSEGERREFRAARERLCTILAGSREMHFESYRNDPALYDSMTTGICHAYNGLVLWTG